MDAGISGARPPTQHAGKSLSLRYSDADVSTISWFDATSVTRPKASELMRRNSNALTEVDAETSLARFPVLRRRRASSRPRPDMLASIRLALVRVFTSGDCEERDSVRRKNAAEALQAQTVVHRKLHPRSRDSDDEPTPAFFHALELGPRGNARPSARVVRIVRAVGRIRASPRQWSWPASGRTPISA